MKAHRGTATSWRGGKLLPNELQGRRARTLETYATKNGERQRVAGGLRQPFARAQGKLATEATHGERQWSVGAGEGTLREACAEFEGLFLSMLFRAMRATVPREGLLSSGSAGEIFDSMWTEEVGRAAARLGPLGIAEMLMGAVGGEDEVGGGSSEGQGLSKRGVRPLDRYGGQGGG